MVRDSCLWDSGRWEGWERILGLIPPYYRDIWSHKTSETFLFLLSQYWVGVQQKVNDLLTSEPSNQFRDYFIWNRIEKLVPQHWNFAPRTLNTLQKTTKLFSNLDFLRHLGFRKLGISISRNDPQRKKKTGKCQKHQNLHLLIK